MKKFIYEILSNNFQYFRKKIGGRWYRLIIWDDMFESYTETWKQSDSRPREYNIPYSDTETCGIFISDIEVWPIEETCS